jgi:hypothetical protein
MAVTGVPGGNSPNQAPNRLSGADLTYIGA